jgi:hypothetical protein
MASTELTVTEPGGYLALNSSPSELQAIIAANLGGDEIGEFDLPRVKIPAGGGRTWEIPGPTGTDSIQELQGVLVHFKRTRAYWPNEDPDGSPPQCRSADGVIGVGDPGGQCRRCPLSQFGAAGERPACQEKEVWFLLREGLVLPLVLILPATSLRAAKNYRIGTLAAAAIPAPSVVTSLRLEADRNRDGQAFSRAVPSIAARLSDEEAQRARAYADAFRPLFDATAAAVTTETDVTAAPNGKGAATEPEA